jgi:hypothetical protein
MSLTSESPTYWNVWGRIHYALFALAAMVFLLQLQYWNLLGWRF